MSAAYLASHSSSSGVVRSGSRAATGLTVAGPAPAHGQALNRGLSSRSVPNRVRSTMCRVSLRARARPQLPQGRPATAAAAAWAATRWCCIPDSTSCASARASPALAMVRSSRAIAATRSIAGGVPSWASMTI